jgi:hypothetical protein
VARTITREKKKKKDGQTGEIKKHPVGLEQL